MKLTQQTMDLAKEPNLAMVSTLFPSGLIQTQPLWVDADSEHVLINTEIHRSKFKNVQSDPRITVTILDRNDPMLWSEVRGRIAEVVRGSEAREHIDALAMKYTGGKYTLPIESERVILKVAPEKVFDFKIP